VILNILVSLLLITMGHSPDVEIDLYINGELQGNGTSEYHESTWLGYDNDTIFTWNGGLNNDRKNNTTSTNTTHKLNRLSPKGTQGI